jgi:hypothetical protein
MWSYYDLISPWPYTEQYDRIQRKTEIVYGLRVLRQWTTVFSSVYRRMSPYTTRRYTIVIRSHVNRCISPYTVVYDRACSTWVQLTQIQISLCILYEFASWKIHQKKINERLILWFLFLIHIPSESKVSRKYLPQNYKTADHHWSIHLFCVNNHDNVRWW